MLIKFSVCVMVCAITLVQCDVSHLFQPESAFGGYNYPAPRNPCKKCSSFGTCLVKVFFICLQIGSFL